MTRQFRAPWGREVMILTIIGCVVIGALVLIQLLQGFWLIPVVLGAILATVVVNGVTGYEVAPGELRVRRRLRTTRWPLDSVTRAIVRPHVMRGAWRIWGNGGLFAITGRFSGSGLGRFHAYVTDPSRTVVIETGCGIVVVSPDAPQEFAAAVTAAAAPR